ncbi:hypothetical protein, partial [Vibrio cholerae]|uniref:hypothetical protein n=1 Tax=Vibrio cholerae TaxID=666 RepID=UPI0021CC3718
MHKNPAFLLCDWNGSIIPIRYAKASAAVQRGVNSEWSTIKVRSPSVSSIPVKRSKFYNSSFGVQKQQKIQLKLLNNINKNSL